MCGIAGFVSSNEQRDPREARALLQRMCSVIAHRGPDDQGTLVRNQVALGMRRLSIIDLTGGHQPMSGCDGAVTIVFNGEIYNYRELQRGLEPHGHRGQHAQVVVRVTSRGVSASIGGRSGSSARRALYVPGVRS